MKVGIISDVHGNHMALAVVLTEFRRQRITDVLFLGDMVGYYPFVKECIALLSDFQVISVRGNHDQVGLECLTSGMRTDEAYRRACGSSLDRALDKLDTPTEAFLRAMPLQQQLNLAGRTALLCHGSPWDALEGRVYPDFQGWNRFTSLGVDTVLLGHTHYPVRQECGSVLVLNPGSVGQPRQRSGVACAAVLELPALSVSLLQLSYDPACLIDDARKHDLGLPYLVDVLRR